VAGRFEAETPILAERRPNVAGLCRAGPKAEHDIDQGHRRRCALQPFERAGERLDERVVGLFLELDQAVAGANES
jgi:hypothetical protein